MSWRRTTETSWQHSIEMLLSVLFETYLWRYWDVQRDVITTSSRCHIAAWVSYSCSLIETIPRKFQGFGECSFGCSEKDRYFLKISKWQHKLIREYKRGKLASYFLDNAAKTCSYRLKLSENIEIKHVFQSKSFFHNSNFLHTSCLSAFKFKLVLTKNKMDVQMYKCINPECTNRVNNKSDIIMVYLMPEAYQNPVKYLRWWGKLRTVA